MYTILEDASPFYIKFKHDNIQIIIEKCKDVISQNLYMKSFSHHCLDKNISEEILNLVPMSKTLDLNENRVSLFVTRPGYYYRAHKDGLNCRISLNYMVSVLDDQCVTSWYSDEDLKNYPIDNLETNSSREADGFIKSNHIPLKSTVFKEGECVLFNTDIFHDFDNSKSKNLRAILTLRLNNPGNLYFEDIKKILFNDR